MVQARDGRRLEVMTSGPDCAADVAAILDHLGAEQFVTAGRSGGGTASALTASGWGANDASGPSAYRAFHRSRSG